MSSALFEDKQAPAKIMEGSCGFFVSVSSPLLFLLFFIKHSHSPLAFLLMHLYLP